MVQKDILVIKPSLRFNFDREYCLNLIKPVLKLFSKEYSTTNFIIKANAASALTDA